MFNYMCVAQEMEYLVEQAAIVKANGGILRARA